MKRMVFAIATIVTIAAAVPGTAIAQYRATRAERADNAAERNDLRARMDTLDGQIAAAQTNRGITRTRASQLHRKLEAVRQSYGRVTREQRFVSAAESASYNRTLDEIDDQLSR